MNPAEAVGHFAGWITYCLGQYFASFMLNSEVVMARPSDCLETFYDKRAAVYGLLLVTQARSVKLPEHEAIYSYLERLIKL